jgi:hypothetical protein
MRTIVMLGLNQHMKVECKTAMEPWVGLSEENLYKNI